MKILFDMPSEGYNLDELMLSVQEGFHFPDSANNRDIVQALFPNVSKNIIDSLQKIKGTAWLNKPYKIPN